MRFLFKKDWIHNWKFLIDEKYVVPLRFLKELRLFLSVRCSKYAVFRTFLLHAKTYWDEILNMTLFLCSTDQVRVAHCVNVWRSHASFWTYNNRKYTVSLHFLTTNFDILSWNFTYVFVFMYYWSSLSVFTLRPSIFRTFLIHALTNWVDSGIFTNNVCGISRWQLFPCISCVRFCL